MPSCCGGRRFSYIFFLSPPSYVPHIDLGEWLQQTLACRILERLMQGYIHLDFVLRAIVQQESIRDLLEPFEEVLFVRRR